MLIVPFHKSQDTLLHPGLNDQIQNTLFTEDPHVTRALWGWFDWLPGSACADLNWSALVNHIGIHPLPATQPTLIGHALYIKPRPSQFSVPHVPPCLHGNGEIFVCNISLIKIAKIIRYFVGTSQVIIIQISDWRAIFYTLKYQWKTTQSAHFKWTDDLYLWGHGNMENE